MIDDTAPVRSYKCYILESRLLYRRYPRTRRLELPVQFHALLEPVGNSTLPGSSRLSEGDRATEWTSTGTVADAHDADVGSTSDGSIASHASGHLDLHLEVGGSRKRKTLDAKSGNVLSDGCGLHGRLLSSAGCSIHIGLEGAGSILVDL